MEPKGNRMFLGLCVFAACAGMIAAGLIYKHKLYAMAASKTVTDWLESVPIPRHLVRPLSQNASDFESGNMGEIERSGNQIVLNLRSDNDETWPPYWRQWWYARLDDLDIGKTYTMTLRGRGHWNLYLPVYSYDGKTWRPFKREEVSQPSRLTLQFKKSFAKEQVWIARYVPYTYTKLLDYLDRLPKGAHIKRYSIGRTEQDRRIPALRIGKKEAKEQVFIHARTHPGEVASSFLLEGLIDEFVANSKRARAALKKIQLTIVPMLNVDGVVIGNNRVSPRNINLEGKWNPHPEDETRLSGEGVPREVRLLNRAYRRALRRGPAPTMALNLHSSNGQPGDRTFFFPHFGSRKLGYTTNEANLWNKQIGFVNMWKFEQGTSWFNRLPREGGRDFIKKDVPESWWWRNYKDQVMALSIESTYGEAGDGREWTRPDDLRAMGGSLARTIMRYHGVSP